MYQLRLGLAKTKQTRDVAARQVLVQLLGDDLDFHGQNSQYASHNFHAFPAKFPPQLPRKFIEALTQPGETVLDPMVGSGTTAVEAYLAGRAGVGFDFDPLAVKMCVMKTTPLDVVKVAGLGHGIVSRARAAVNGERGLLERRLQDRWDPNTHKFVDFWFAHDTQIELLALSIEIDAVADPALQVFLQLVLSSTIITKTGGVSIAYDLAHTRPHRAKVVIGTDGRILRGRENVARPSRRTELLTKTLRSPLDEYAKRLRRNLKGLTALPGNSLPPIITVGDAQTLPLGDSSIDLVVTSPPYAFNAIDYMRAHKFSLVWMGHTIAGLGRLRREYIGGEAIGQVRFDQLPTVAAAVVAELSRVDATRGRRLHRYYSEMKRVLGEICRVLKPGKAAVVVVGVSVIRGLDTRTDVCLAEIGKAVGLEVAGIGVRDLDRNRRMMPAGLNLDLSSQIQQRMHQEYVIGFCKPRGCG